MKVKDLLDKFDPACDFKRIDIAEMDGFIWLIIGSLNKEDIECKAYAKYANRTVISFKFIHYTKEDEYIFRIYTKPVK